MVAARRHMNEQVWWQRLVSYAPYIVIGTFLITFPSFGGSYTRDTVTRVLIFAVFAMSLNLIFGYAGLFSMGHAAFFGLGGYATGILMVRLGITSFWVVLPLSVLIVAVFASVFGVIALQLRSLYFMLVTIALGEALYNLAIKWVGLTGGTNGMPGIPYPDIGLPQFVMTSISFYYLVLIVSTVCFYLLYRITASPFGYALQGIREDEVRLQVLGYNTWLCKYVAYVIAGLFAGAAGALAASLDGFIAPEKLGVATSILAMLTCIIGGTTVVWGPILGAAVVVLLQHYASIYFPARWPLVMGCVFVLAVMFLRGGIGIHLVSLRNRMRSKFGYTSDKD